METIRVAGERLGGGSSAETTYDVSQSYAVFAEEGDVAYRSDITASLHGEDVSEAVATVEASLVALYEVSDLDEVDHSLFELFGASTVPLVLHPYLREVVATTAARLGFFGVTLPMFVVPTAVPEA